MLRASVLGSRLAATALAPLLLAALAGAAYADCTCVRLDGRTQTTAHRDLPSARAECVEPARRSGQFRSCTVRLNRTGQTFPYVFSRAGSARQGAATR